MPVDHLLERLAVCKQAAQLASLARLERAVLIIRLHNGQRLCIVCHARLHRGAGRLCDFTIRLSHARAKRFATEGEVAQVTYRRRDRLAFLQMLANELALSHPTLHVRRKTQPPQLPSRLLRRASLSPLTHFAIQNVWDPDMPTSYRMVHRRAGSVRAQQAKGAKLGPVDTLNRETQHLMPILAITDGTHRALRVHEVQIMAALHLHPAA